MSLEVPDDAAGKVLTCPACGRKFRVPGLQSPSIPRRPGVDTAPSVQKSVLLPLIVIIGLVIGILIFYNLVKKEPPTEEKPLPMAKKEAREPAETVESAEPSEPEVTAAKVPQASTPAKMPPSPQLLWTYESESEFTEASLVFANGVILATSPRDGIVYALDARTGQPKWTYDIEAEVWGQLIAGGGRGLVGAYDRKMYAFDIATGKLLWKGLPTLATGRMAGITHSPELAEDTLYYVAGNRLIAAQPTDGNTKWAWTIPEGDFKCGPVAAGDYLLLVHGFGLTAFNKETKSPKWTITSEEVGDYIMYYRPLVSGSHLYFQVGKYVAAFDLETGSKVWEYSDAQMDFFGPFYMRLVLHQGVLYVAGSEGNYLYALDAKTGELKWKKEFPEKVVSTPAASGSRLFVAVGQTLYAIDIKTQEIYWEYDLEAETRYGLIIAEGKLFVATKGGKIFAFEP
jgi:outer membrane protein assembly factor BamB